MKRVSRHILFWLVYLALDTVFVYLADSRFTFSLSISARIFIALKVSLVLLLPKILLTYYLMYVMLERIVKQKAKFAVNVLFIIITYIIAISIYWVLEIYFIYPYVYNEAWPKGAFVTGISFLFALIDLGFVSGVAVAIRQVHLQLAAKEKEKLLIKDKLETELKFLKNQTNPHFLFNTLNNIYALARKKSDHTPDVVMKLSKILRFMIYESGRDHITIAEEIKLIEDYIDLEKLRYGERLLITFEKAIDNDTQIVSPMLLLPFVENAFKHGASENRFHSFIHIGLKVNGGLLHFNIENNKTEEVHQEEVGERIGLVNIRRQLELLYADYKMKVENEVTTFKVILQVNLNSYGKV